MRRWRCADTHALQQRGAQARLMIIEQTEHDALRYQRERRRHARGYTRCARRCGRAAQDGEAERARELLARCCC